ncbi:hypothetical protein ACN6LM_003910 [Streptomyces sp. SAS_281]|uniref:hypothetical protein n=1 Tax=Streptomyces sp. SAS_281 TaxID=3412744 RepID=UPI00403C344B
MSKPNRKRYKMQEVRQQFEEVLGGPEIELELMSGELVTFPHPLFADDEWSARVDACETNRDKARAILGDEQYEKWTAAGHQDAEIGLLYVAVQQDMQSEVKKRPTRR